MFKVLACEKQEAFFKKMGPKDMGPLVELPFRKTVQYVVELTAQGSPIQDVDLTPLSLRNLATHFTRLDLAKFVEYHLLSRNVL